MTHDNRVQYCHNNNCTSRDDCLYPHITHPEGLYFFGQGYDKERCEDFVQLTEYNKDRAKKNLK